MVIRMIPLGIAGSGAEMLRTQGQDLGASAPGISWVPVAFVLAALILFSLVTFFVIPAIIARRASVPRQFRVNYRTQRTRVRARPPVRPAPSAGSKPTGPTPEDEAFIPINFQCVPSAGFLSRRLRDAAARAKTAARSVENDVPEQYLQEMEARLTEQEQHIVSQQERLAWMEDRLQTMSMEVRTLRQMLHQQGARPAARPATTPWRLPLLGGGSNRRT